MLSLKVIFWKLSVYFFVFLHYCFVGFRLLVKLFAFIFKMLYAVRSFVSGMFHRLLGFVSGMFHRLLGFVSKVCHFFYEAVRVIFFCFLVFVAFLYFFCVVAVRELFRRKGWDYFFISRFHRLLGFVSKSIRALNFRLFVNLRSPRVFFYLKYFWKVGRSGDFKRLFFLAARFYKRRFVVMYSVLRRRLSGISFLPWVPSSEIPMTFLQFSCCYWFTIYFFITVIRQLILFLWTSAWYVLNMFYEIKVVEHSFLDNPVTLGICTCLFVIWAFIFIYFLIIMSYYTHLYKSGRIASKEEFLAFVFV